MRLEGRVRLGSKTKKLVKKLHQGEIAVIAHRDIDQLAAQSLIRSGAKAVINAQPSISGKYPNLGPEKLLAADIPVIDEVGEEIFFQLNTGDQIKIKDGKIFKDRRVVSCGRLLRLQQVKTQMKQIRNNMEEELNKFIENTLSYAKKEKDLLLELETPVIDTDLSGKEVLMVVRGKNYRKDLETVASYINDVDPVLIGVDGGADALVESGFTPDLIIGDMDSVSDEVLNCGAELIVHAYPDGRAPGMERINRLNLEAKKFPAPGTSEDITMLLAYEKRADLIVAVGTHTNMIDFLEKGRPGMASTFLARLKVGDKLVDAKGVNKLYTTKVKTRYFFQLLAASLIPILAVAAVSPSFYQLIRLLFIKLRFSFSF